MRVRHSANANNWWLPAIGPRLSRLDQSRRSKQTYSDRNLNVTVKLRTALALTGAGFLSVLVLSWSSRPPDGGSMKPNLISYRLLLQTCSNIQVSPSDGPDTSAAI